MPYCAGCGSYATPMVRNAECGLIQCQSKKQKQQVGTGSPGAAPKHPMNQADFILTPLREKGSQMPFIKSPQAMGQRQCLLQILSDKPLRQRSKAPAISGFIRS